MSINKKLRSPSCDIRNDEFYRNRSVSISSPVTKEFHYQEVNKTWRGTLIRSISCGMVYDKNSDKKLYKAACVQVTNLISPERSYRKVIRSESTGKKRFGGHYPVKNFDDDVQPCSTVKAKKSLEFSNHKNVEGEEKESILLYTNIKFIILTIIVAVLSWYYVIHLPHCNEIWNTTRTVLELKELVYGQEEALLQIEHNLSNLSNVNNTLLLLFTGPAGVGKTYTSNIIGKSFPWKSNINFILKKTDSYNSRISACGINLIVIDGFQLREVIEALKLIKTVSQDAILNGKKVIFIVIFNTKTDETSVQLMNIFEQARVIANHVPFKVLTSEAVMECFILESSRRNYQFVESDLGDLINFQVEALKNFPGYSACKEVVDRVSNYKNS